MVSNLGNSNFKRKTILSLILGIVSIVWPLLSPYLWYYQSWFYFLSLLGAIICAVIGLNFGIRGLKLPKKNPAILGITLSLIGLLFSLYMFFGWIMVGGPLFL